MEWENLYAFYYYSKFYPVGYLKIVSKFNKGCAKAKVGTGYRIVGELVWLVGVSSVEQLWQVCYWLACLTQITKSCSDLYSLSPTLIPTNFHQPPIQAHNNYNNL